MAYAEIIRRNGKQYYYLTKNIRMAVQKWKKIRVYLGDKRPSKEALSRAIKRIEEKSKRLGLGAREFTYLSEHDAETLQDLKEGYKAWLRRVPESAQKRIDEDFVIRFTYNSNAIEGNRLTLRQTALILKERIIPSGIRAQEYNEAINGKDCLEFLKAYKGDFNQRLLLKVNEILTKNTGVVYTGRIRFFDVKIEGSNHIPPGHTELKKHLLKLYKWYSANKRKLHPFELAAVVHAKLAWIHPFEDGNGRTARAIMNFILRKKELPMFFIPYEKREEYYKALEQADQGDYRWYVADMLSLIIDQIRMYGHKKRKR